MSKLQELREKRCGEINSSCSLSSVYMDKKLIEMDNSNQWRLEWMGTGEVRTEVWIMDCKQRQK
jgi:hypothetical protein